MQNFLKKIYSVHIVSEAHESMTHMAFFMTIVPFADETAKLTECTLTAYILTIVLFSDGT